MQLQNRSPTEWFNAGPGFRAATPPGAARVPAVAAALRSAGTAARMRAVQRAKGGAAMLARRFAAAVGLFLAVVFSQAPEFVQQYRQRLGGALDELKRAIALFDAEAAGQGLSREAGIARLRANADPLVQGRGLDLARDVERERQLAAQEEAFAAAGPALRYWVFAERFDPEIAGRAYAIFQPAVPVTASGLAAAAVGFAAGYGGTRLAASPFRRRRRGALAA